MALTYIAHTAVVQYTEAQLGARLELLSMAFNDRLLCGHLCEYQFLWPVSAQTCKAQES